MGGKKQHYIPRLLMKGFASRIKKDNVYTMVYQRESNPFEKKLMDIGYEDYFYDYDDILGDTVITGQEQGFIELVHSIRYSGFINNIDVLNEYIVHIALRSKYYRTILSQGVQTSISQMTDHFLKSEEGRLQLFQYTLRGNKLELMIKDILKEKSLPFSEEYISLIKNEFEKNKSEFRNGMTKALQEVACKLDDYLEYIPKEVKKNHVISIYENEKPEGWLSRLQRIKWEILSLDVGEGYFVCGDCGPIQYQNDKWQPLITGSKSIDCILFPISNDKLIYGFDIQKDCVDTKKLLKDFKAINTAIAKLSANFFISHMRHDYNDELHSFLGTEWVQLFDYEKIFVDFLQKKGFQ